MLISKVFFYQGKHAFHLYLNVNRTGNKLFSTVPICLLNKMYPNTLATIKHAYIPSIHVGNKLLQMLAEKILHKSELHPYFYQDYILNNSRISIELAKKIINFQEIIPLFPSSYYTKSTDSLKFFVLNQTYLRKKRHIIRTAKYINKDYFEYNYIFNREMGREFEQFNQMNLFYIELLEDDEVEYVLLLNSDKELLMVVSL